MKLSLVFPAISKSQTTFAVHQAFLPFSFVRFFIEPGKFAWSLYCIIEKHTLIKIPILPLEFASPLLFAFMELAWIGALIGTGFNAFAMRFIILPIA